MKKGLAIMVLVASVLPLISAQTRATDIGLKVNLGYGLGRGGLCETWDPFGLTTYDKDVYFSYGEGMKANLTLMFIRKDITIELGSGFSKGQSDPIKGKWVYEEEQNSWEMTLKTSYIPLTLTFLKRFSQEKYVPYLGAGFGLYIPFLSLESYGDAIHQGQNISWTNKVKRTAPIALGFQGVTGIEFPILKKMWAFGEIRFTQLSFTITREERTEYTENGEDKLDKLPRDQVIYEYRKNDDEKDPPFTIPANSLTFGLGIAYRF